jgi:hypothetical protein
MKFSAGSAASQLPIHASELSSFIDDRTSRFCAVLSQFYVLFLCTPSPFSVHCRLGTAEVFSVLLRLYTRGGADWKMDRANLVPIGDGTDRISRQFAHYHATLGNVLLKAIPFCLIHHYLIIFFFILVAF